MKKCHHCAEQAKSQPPQSGDVSSQGGHIPTNRLGKNVEVPPSAGYLSIKTTSPARRVKDISSHSPGIAVSDVTAEQVAYSQLLRPEGDTCGERKGLFQSDRYPTHKGRSVLELKLNPSFSIHPQEILEKIS